MDRQAGKDRWADGEAVELANRQLGRQAGRQVNV